jgi:hypothetical protein
MRTTETCVDGEVKGAVGHKWGPSRLRYDVLGFAALHDFGAYPDSGASVLDFPQLGWRILRKSATQHAVFMVPACCPQIWEHMGVMAGDVMMKTTAWEAYKSHWLVYASFLRFLFVMYAPIRSIFVCWNNLASPSRKLDYESKSLVSVYGLIRKKLLHVASSTLPWAVELRISYDTISTKGGFSESDLVVLTNPLMGKPHQPIPIRHRTPGGPFPHPRRNDNS